MHLTVWTCIFPSSCQLFTRYTHTYIYIYIYTYILYNRVYIFVLSLLLTVNYLQNERH